MPIKIPKVKCFVCGQELKYINSTHLWMRHGMIIAEYKEKFPDAEIMCEKEKEIRKKVGGNMGNGNSGGIHSKDHNNNIGESVRRYINNNKEQWHEDRSRIATDGNNRREFSIVSCQKEAVEKAKEWAKNNPEKKSEIAKRAAKAAWAKKGHREKMEPILRNNAKNIVRPSKSQLVLIDVVRNIFSFCEPEHPVRCKDGKLCLIDAAVPELFLAFEFDGKFWHKDQKKDEKREKYLNDEGWIVLHYNEDNNLVEDVACDVVSLLHGGIIDSSSVKDEAILNLLRVTSDTHKEEVMLNAICVNDSSFRLCNHNA